MRRNPTNKLVTSNTSRNKEVVLGILQDEVRSDWKNAIEKLHESYSMTWVNKSLGKLFRRVKRDKNFNALIKSAYAIKGRKYDIKNIVADDKCVMVELIESYPDVKTKKIFRTPLVLVLEFDGNKIKRGRHYCDPNLSYLHLTDDEIHPKEDEVRAYKWVPFVQMKDYLLFGNQLEDTLEKIKEIFPSFR